MVQKKGFSIFLYLIIIIPYLFEFISSYIVLPFKINSPQIDGNITKIFNEFLKNRLIITLPMGTPKKNVDFYASMNEYIYYLAEGSCNSNYITSSYNMNNSQTFKERKKIFCGVNLDDCYFGEDIIHLYQDINLTSTKECSFPFYYGTRKENAYKNDKKICGELGFQIDNGPFRFYDYDNFISLLKQNGIINSYSWYIHYFNNINKKNDFDGAIIFDILNPGFFSDFPFLKKDDDYNTVNAKDIEGILSWTFNFDKIYYTYNDTKFEIQIVNSGLAFETDFIHAPEAYFESIKKNFFEFYFINNICFLVEERYKYIYCEKSFEKYKETFPSLFFKSLGLNKTYILTPDELFKDCGKIFLFMIIQPKYTYKLWTLGKIFMKKNNFYFDSNKKLIGYFDVVETKKEINISISNENFFGKIKWFIFIFVGILIGIFIGKKIKEKNRKLRANELEDNYEYLGNKINEDKNSNNKKDDNNIDLDIKKNSNYGEIKSKLYQE